VLNNMIETSKGAERRRVTMNAITKISVTVYTITFTIWRPEEKRQERAEFSAIGQSNVTEHSGICKWHSPRPRPRRQTRATSPSCQKQASTPGTGKVSSWTSQDADMEVLAEE
jgi:hypothetical protein